MGKMKTSFVGEEADKNKVKSQKAHKGEAEKVHIAGLKGGQRVKMVDAEPVTGAETTQSEGAAAKGGRKTGERVRGKKYVEAKKKFDHEKYFAVNDAVKLVKESSYSKFEGTMELHITVKKTGTNVQVNLPHQAGRVKKVEIATEDTIEKLKSGKVDFDVLVATQVMMPKLVPFARLLGPKGLMPNPKNGTLVANEAQAKKFSTGSVTLKTEKEAPLIHTVIGKVSQKDEEIAENAEAILKSLGGSKQVIKAFMKSSMSPSVKILVK